MQAYSPLGHPNGGGKAVFELPEVLKIARAHGKSGAQIALRYIVQLGYPFVTASGLSNYDVQDLDLFSWQLTDAEMATLNAVRCRR